mgnify:CR=1 FL=1
MREQIIQKILDEKLIVIVRGLEKEKMIPLAEAMYEGGIRLIEVTFSANGSIPDEVTAECIRSIGEHFGGRMFVGAGTVLTPAQVGLTKAAGGSFIISPNVNEEVIKRTRELGMVSMPGALTPSEIENAHGYGADFVKVFPVSTLGPEYIKAVRAPLSHIRLLAVGGVDQHNLKDYLKAGVCGFGMASNIVDKKAVAEGNYAAITELARCYVEAVGSAS